MSYNFTDWANNRTFVINRKTKTLVKSFTNPQHDEAVKFIDSFPIPERYDYCTTSRNGLATSGMYPKNKTGNSQLEADLRQLEEPHSELKILRKYQALPEVELLNKLISDEAESVQISAANRLAGYTQQAMKEANESVADFSKQTARQRKLEMQLLSLRSKNAHIKGYRAVIVGNRIKESINGMVI